MSQKQESIGYSPWTFQLFHLSVQTENYLQFFDDGKITLFTELIKGNIPPVLPRLGYFLYMLTEVGSAVGSAFPNRQYTAFTKLRQKTSARAWLPFWQLSYRKILPSREIPSKLTESDSPNLEKI